jgi:hypothetical protein
MAITKVTSGLISADASSIDLNIDAGTLYLDVSENRVGIGTTSPSEKLEVSNTSGGASVLIKTSATDGGNLLFGDTDSNSIGRVRYDHSANAMQFYANAAERMRIESDGNLRVYDVIDNIANTLTLNGRNTGQIHFQSGGSEKMRIDSSGNLLVGTTGTITGYFPAQVQINTVGNNGIVTKVTTAGEASYNSWNSATSGTRTHCQFYDGATRAIRGSITSNGSATAYNTSSDYRLKENVNYDFTALDRVSQLKPARFNFIADETNTLVDGFLAHEVSSIVPEAVTGEKDAVDDEGNPEYQGIDQSKLVPLLTKAIQEQQTIIDNLKTRIETLESA